MIKKNREEEPFIYFNVTSLRPSSLHGLTLMTLSDTKIRGKKTNKIWVEKPFRDVVKLGHLCRTKGCGPGHHLISMSQWKARVKLGVNKLLDYSLSWTDHNVDGETATYCNRTLLERRGRSTNAGHYG